MNVALIGYGKMGKMIEVIISQRGHKVAMIVDENNMEELTAGNLKSKKIDVAIDFSSMKSAPDSIKTTLEAGVPVVSGTTGWGDRMDEIEACSARTGSAFMHASNFSIGVNVMFHLNKQLARIMSQFEQYDVTVEEVHHAEKKDAPGGTAITLAEQIIHSDGRKNRWVGAPTIVPNELGVTAVRRGDVVGKHTVTYESTVDMITLEHNAKTREGFAIGAVMAAEYIKGKSGVQSIEDMLGFQAK